MALAVGWPGTRAAVSRIASVVLVIWALLLLTEASARILLRAAGPSEWVGLERLHGIRVPVSDAAWMRGLAAALERGDPRAAVLLAGNRNDMNVFAETTPYWLTSRPPASAYHELHPGVTDTEAVQHRIIAELPSEVAPIVVREYRFADPVVDAVMRDLLPHVPVGSRVLDTWIASRYAPGERFGRYEVMLEK
jgi:hypothetical protein